MNGRHELLAEKFWKEIPISHLPSWFSKILYGDAIKLAAYDKYYEMDHY